MNERISMIRPPLFGNGAAADSRRWEFDLKNKILLTNKTPVDVVSIGDSITQMREGLTEDGLYPHVFGYNVMAEVLKPLLESVLRNGEGGAEP